MKKHIFIFGKNPGLSLAEIVSYLESRSVKFKIDDVSEEFASIISEELPYRIGDDLGGTIKICEVIGDDFKKINYDKIFNNISDGSFFGLSSYGADDYYEDILNKLKKHAKETGFKLSHFYPESRKILTHVELINKKLIERGFEVVICHGEKYHICRTIYVHNPFEFQKRDMDRPVQRAIFSIPPRLCKIMINLSRTKEGVLLDPFCGIGAILQEAVLMGYDIRGIDINKKAIRGCIENLMWLEDEYSVKIKDLVANVRTGDARSLGDIFGRSTIDAVVTEPYLGKPLKESPNISDAKKILDEISPLFENAISSMLKVVKPGKRIVIVSPVFRIDKESFGLDIGRLANRYGGRVIDPLDKYNIEHADYYDFEKRHRTIRKINIIQKRG